MVNRLPMSYSAGVRGQRLGAKAARRSSRATFKLCGARAARRPSGATGTISKQNGRNSALCRTLRVRGAEAGMTEMDDNTA
jgi:hypothetical protein